MERAWEIRRRVLGNDHPDTLSTLTNLATAYATAGRWKEALPLIEEAVRGCQATLPPDTL